jgi:uncharacterized protein YndB with AHSA1/START domain
MTDETFVYVTFIESSPERVFEALTKGEFTQRFWAGRRIESDWSIGAPVHLYLEDTDDFEVSGKVVAFDPPTRLAYTFNSKAQPKQADSTVSFELMAMGESVRLTVTQDNIGEGDMARQGWAAIMSSLKTFLETGKPLSATEMWRTRGAAAAGAQAQ